MDLNINITSWIVFCSLLGIITAGYNGKKGFQKKAMRFSTFKEKIIGKLGKVMYRLESPRWPVETHHLVLMATLVEPTPADTELFDFEIHYKFRQDSLNPCVHGKHVYHQVHVNDWPIKYAVFDGPNPINSTVDARMSFISSNATLYTLVYYCMDKATIVDGECEGDFAVELNIFGNAPDMVAWEQIARDLNRLGLTTMDPLMRFLYLNEECPGHWGHSVR